MSLVDNFTGWFERLTDTFLSDPIFYAAIGIVVFALIVMFFYTLGNIKSGKFWVGILIGAMAISVAMIMQYFANLITVVYLGLTLSDVGATLFVLGMGLFLAVITYNLVVTGGKKAVQ